MGRYAATAHGCAARRVAAPPTWRRRPAPRRPGPHRRPAPRRPDPHRRPARTAPPPPPRGNGSGTRTGGRRRRRRHAWPRREPAGTLLPPPRLPAPPRGRSLPPLLPPSVGTPAPSAGGRRLSLPRAAGVVMARRGSVYLYVPNIIGRLTGNRRRGVWGVHPGVVGRGGWGGVCFGEGRPGWGRRGATAPDPPGRLCLVFPFFS